MTWQKLTGLDHRGRCLLAPTGEIFVSRNRGRGLSEHAKTLRQKRRREELQTFLARPAFSTIPCRLTLDRRRETASERGIPVSQGNVTSLTL